MRPWGTPSLAAGAPPRSREAARLAQRKVLLLHMKKEDADVCTFEAGWLRGQPSPLEPSTMELLRIEYLLSPATRAQQATLRKVAEVSGCSAPMALQSSQV